MSDKNSTQGAGSLPPEGTSKTSKAKPTSAGAEAKTEPTAAGTDATVDPIAESPETATSTKSAPPAPEASSLPDLEAHAEPPAWLSGGEDHDGQIWEGAFEAEAGASEPTAEHGSEAATEEEAVEEAVDEAVEPEVTNPDDVTLETPSLGNADISSDAAEAASLGDATAEVKEVEAQAADAAVLTDPAANHPAAVNRTEGIAAAAPMIGSSPDTPEPETWEPKPTKPETSEPEAAEPETADAPAAAEDKGAVDPKNPDAAASAEPTESRRSRRESEPSPSGGNGNNGRNKRLLLIAGIIGVLAVLVVLLFTVILGSEKEPGVLEENVAPIELESGACLSGFTGVNDPTTVVTCETPHNAQLVATATYADDDEFPGSDALTERANEVCDGVRYTETAAANGDLNLQVNKAVPTPASWEDGDRRVDCFVVAGEGQELTESLIEQ